MTPKEKKQYIISEIESGRKQVDIAKELGLTRGAVSATWRRYQNQGEAFLEVNGRGRMVERAVLSENECALVYNWIQEHEPKDLDLDVSDWDLYSVKKAVLFLTKKRVNLNGAHRVFNYAKEHSPELIKLTDEDLSAVKIEKTISCDERRPKRGRPVGSGNGGFPSVEEMEQSNLEIRTRLAKFENQKSSSLKHGLKTGKRANAKGSPVQKKRKKKRR